MKTKRTHRSLVSRLRTPIDPHENVISPHNDISNIGLREVADKLDAIGEALAYLIEKKHAKKRVKKIRKAVEKSGKRERWLNEAADQLGG